MSSKRPGDPVSHDDRAKKARLNSSQPGTSNGPSTAAEGPAANGNARPAVNKQFTLEALRKAKEALKKQQELKERLAKLPVRVRPVTAARSCPL